jgi:IstB-like ATP binding protein
VDDLNRRIKSLDAWLDEWGRRDERVIPSNYRPSSGNGSRLRAFNYAYRFVHDYPAVERGLLLAGPCGVGKAHLAAAIIGGLIEKGVPCLFYEVGALLKSLSRTSRRRCPAVTPWLSSIPATPPALTGRR